MSALHVVVLAAGKGRRMRSEVPKVLHELAGRALLRHVVEAARGLAPEALHVVVGDGGELVRAHLADPDLRWVWQHERLGTGHALCQAMPEVPDEATLLVLCGDVPLVSHATLEASRSAAAGGALALVTVSVDDPAGYGRILSDEAGRITGIVEDRDADERTRAIDEINSGILAAPAGGMRRWLRRLHRRNAQSEYYLTGVVAHAVADGAATARVRASSPEEVLGVNDRVQLARLERYLQARLGEQLMREGATLMDPARVDIRGRVRVGRDVCIDANVIFEGEVILGDGVRIGPHTCIRSSELGARSEVLGHCHIEHALVGEDCRIGPFARLRSGTRLDQGVRIGNFVEVKATRIGAGSRAAHLSYLGDSDLGREVNVGAGAITCNYDGANKHRTVIGDRAFVGSGVELVAPVVVGEGANIGAGSTVTKDAPAGRLTVARVRQTVVSGWKRPARKP